MHQCHHLISFVISIVAIAIGKPLYYFEYKNKKNKKAVFGLYGFVAGFLSILHIFWSFMLLLYLSVG